MRERTEKEEEHMWGLGGDHTHFTYEIIKFPSAIQQDKNSLGFSGGPVVKNLPYSAGDVGLSLVREVRSHTPEEQLSLHPTTTEACKLRSPRATTREPVRLS